LVEINKKYKVIGEVDSRYFIVTGGRGSGKSYSINLLLSLLTYEVGHIILFTRYTLRSATISIIPEFIEKLEALNITNDFYITKDEIINKQTGSKILFRGIKTSSGDQTANLKSIQGVTTWVLDEAEELTDENTFDKIDLSVRQKDKDNRVILILNPTTKEHWIYKRFFEGKGIEAGQCVTKQDTTYVTLPAPLIVGTMLLPLAFSSDINRGSAQSATIKLSPANCTFKLNMCDVCKPV